MIKLKKEKKQPTWKVPFDSNGNHSIYPYNHPGGSSIEKDNYIFSADLEFMNFYHSASGIHVYWRDISTGVRYTSTGNLLHDVLDGTKGTPILSTKFTISGTFTFYRQGNSVLLKII